MDGDDEDRAAGPGGADDERLTAAQVAARLGVRRSTLWAYVARGQFPAPDGEFGPKLKWWRASTIAGFSRPGQGARTDRRGPRCGALFGGYGGLEMAVEAVLGVRTVWHAEIDEAASAVLAHHWPRVPNHGDVTAIDWAAMPPVEVLSGGFPCTDVSVAGRRAGMTPSTRSGLWAHMRRAVSVLRPQMVVIENVPGLRYARAHRDVEPGPGDLGDRAAEPVLRGLGAVLGDLAALGYDAQWTSLSAADVGAPHLRERVFVLAVDSAAGPAAAAHSRRPRLEVSGVESDLRGRAPAQRDGQTPVAADRWGDYAPAIECWERRTGHPAPDPTVRGRRGGTTLNPAFSEWMMGLRPGHVTAVPGLSREQQLTLLGNGVVPQQGASALRYLADTLDQVRAA